MCTSPYLLPNLGSAFRWGGGGGSDRKGALPSETAQTQVANIQTQSFVFGCSDQKKKEESLLIHQRQDLAPDQNQCIILLGCVSENRQTHPSGSRSGIFFYSLVLKQ